MTPDEKLRKEDREWLMQQPQFRRHLPLRPGNGRPMES